MMHKISQPQRIVVGLSGGVDSALTAWLPKRQGHEVLGIASNTLWVVQGHEHPWLQSLQLTAGQASWVAGTAPQGGAFAAKTRYRQADAACVLSGVQASRFTLDFAQPQWAVTSGQSAVLYDGEVCLGGGVIDAKSCCTNSLDWSYPPP